MIHRLNTELVTVGANCHFGKGARCTPNFLRSYRQFETREVPLLHVDGPPASSTRIRTFIETGNVGAASRLLGGPFLLEGDIADAHEQGRSMVTVELPDTYVRPAVGVYGAWAHGKAAIVSVRPTGEHDHAPLVEAHLLDHARDASGAPIRIALLERLRHEPHSTNADKLAQQLQLDFERTRHIWSETRSASRLPAK